MYPGNNYAPFGRCTVSYATYDNARLIQRRKRATLRENSEGSALCENHYPSRNYAYIYSQKFTLAIYLLKFPILNRSKYPSSMLATTVLREQNLTFLW